MSRKVAIPEARKQELIVEGRILAAAEIARLETVYRAAGTFVSIGERCAINNRIVRDLLDAERSRIVSERATLRTNASAAWGEYQRACAAANALRAERSAAATLRYRSECASANKLRDESVARALANYRSRTDP